MIFRLHYCIGFANNSHVWNIAIFDTYLSFYHTNNKIIMKLTSTTTCILTGIRMIKLQINAYFRRVMVSPLVSIDLTWKEICNGDWWRLWWYLLTTFVFVISLGFDSSFILWSCIFLCYYLYVMYILRPWSKMVKVIRYWWIIV